MDALFTENSEVERRSLTILPSSGSGISEGVQREVLEREKLEMEKKGIRLKQLEMELKLLKLKSENDFERKMNELELLRNN